MSREKSVRAILAVCCTLALVLYIAAPVFAQGSQSPATDSSPTPSNQQNTGTQNNSATGIQNTPNAQPPATADQNRNDNVARASVPWAWVIGSFIVGLIVGGLAFGGRGRGTGTYYRDRDTRDRDDFRRAA